METIACICIICWFYTILFFCIVHTFYSSIQLAWENGNGSSSILGISIVQLLSRIFYAYCLELYFGNKKSIHLCYCQLYWMLIDSYTLFNYLIIVYFSTVQYCINHKNRPNNNNNNNNRPNNNNIIIIIITQQFRQFPLD